MSASNDRARPLAWDGLEVDNSGQLSDNTTTVPPNWPWDQAVDPLSLKGFPRRCWYSGWQSGYSEGFDRGRREGWQARVEQEERAWQKMRDSIRVPFANVRFSQLAELRGDREAAHYARIRERLLGLGEAS